MLVPLLRKEEIEEIVKRIASEIKRDFPGEEIVFVCLLKGSFVFVSDLIRNIDNPCIVDFIRVSSYGDSMSSSGRVTLTKDLEVDIKGKNVIVVEDIVDSGLTLKYVRDYLSSKGPKDLKICVLLDKRARRQVDIKCDYTGFVFEDGFVVGYGIDCAEKFRNLPEVYILKNEE
ncbi:MAG: hypoxanthine phosphoribosyltransferase [Desulfobacterota bacterium]|nr:hypoxanthine phosphoribosyltransferase [Thermodesulfobacteriota bacterium]MDW8001862.1 hypoxanthine phosphoribosyltransferase [Deltaproteobacteria bacterium]